MYKKLAATATWVVHEQVSTRLDSPVDRFSANHPGNFQSLAGFQVSTYGRFWVSPEARPEAQRIFRLGIQPFSTAAGLLG